MPNKTKIIGEIADLTINLHNNGYNPTQIAQQLPFKTTKETVKAFLLKMNLCPNVRQNALKNSIYETFIKELQEDATNWSVKRKKYNISFDFAKKLMRQYNIPITDRSQAAKNKNYTEEEIQTLLGSKTKLLSLKDGKYELMCEDGHIYHKNVEKIRQGCPNGKSGTKTDTTQMAKELLEIGYQLIEGTFVKKRKSLKAIHIKCGTLRENRFRNFFLQECPTCNNNGTSKEEISLKTWIESLGFATERYKFQERITKPKEIDIHIPSEKIGFEYCGLYDHCEESRHPRKQGYHNGKRIEAIKEGIRLITIFSNEWLERNYQVKSFIKSVLNKNTRKLFAKQCTVKEIDNDYGREFLKTYHIQGPSNALFYYGLFVEQELIGVMSFAAHHRDANSLSVVLSRLCFKENITVVGGASKMLNKAMDKIKQLGFSSIKSWSDNRWSEGNVYAKMGFTLENESAPDYKYVKGNKVYSKQYLKLTPEEQTSNVSESELRKNEGYKKIWDCGKKTWILNLV